MRNALLDARHALRALRRNPWPVFASVLSLALGIGATSTMLAVIDAIDFRPMPFHDAERLVELAEVDGSGARALVSPALFADWQDGARGYASLGAASRVSVSLEDGGRVLIGARVSPAFFETLGARTALGRTINAGDVTGAMRVAVIAHELWQTRFSGARDAIGGTLSLSWAGEYRAVAAEPYTVIGVLPAGLRYPAGTEIWIPALDGYGTSRADQTLAVVGRLRANTTAAGAQAELDAIAQRVATAETQTQRNAVAITLRDAIRATAGERGAAARLPLLLIAAFVLVLATSNVANLFAARAAAQTQDLVIRAALGAPRARIASLMLAQTLGISLAAGVLGILFALWGVRLAGTRLSVAASGAAPVIDIRLILAALTLALISGLVMGLLPVLRTARHDLHATLRQRGTGARGSGRAMQGALVVAQVACAVMLLSGASMVGREFIGLMRRDPGFDPENLLVARLPMRTNIDAQAANLEAGRALERLATTSGVLAASIGGLPGEGYAYRLDDGTRLQGAARPIGYRAGADYFRTLGIPLIAGRVFDARDRAGAPPVGIVSRTAAQRWWPDADAVGRQVFMGDTAGNGEWVTIVGVTDDERVMRNMRAPIIPILYRPFDQVQGERRLTHLFARTGGSTAPLTQSMLQLVQELRGEGGWQGENVTAMREILGSTLDQQRFRTAAFSAFSIFGLLLSALGIYGLVATVVGQRTSEIGIRIALGARPREILLLVTRSGARSAALGLLIGMAASMALGRVMQSLLVSNAGFDPLPPLAAGLCLAATVLIACWLPTRRLPGVSALLRGEN